MEIEETDIASKPLNAHELAALFTAFSGASAGGPRYVDARLVNSWYERRAATGFPEPVGTCLTGGPPARVWDPVEVCDWFLHWTPGKRGARVGNQNGLKHGDFVGLRAERMARKVERPVASEPA